MVKSNNDGVFPLLLNGLIVSEIHVILLLLVNKTANNQLLILHLLSNSWLRLINIFGILFIPLIHPSNDPLQPEMTFCFQKCCSDGVSCLQMMRWQSWWLNSADSDDGRPVVCRCHRLPSMGVRGPVSHHAAGHVWTLSGGHRGLHPDSRQSPGGTRRGGVLTSDRLVIQNVSNQR